MKLERVVLIGRGRPSLGSISPCIALAQHINFQEKGIEPLENAIGLCPKHLKEIAEVLYRLDFIGSVDK